LDLIKQKQLDIPVMWHPQVQIMLRGPVLLLDLGVERRAHP
jgi:hypothetical protein